MPPFSVPKRYGLDIREDAIFFVELEKKQGKWLLGRQQNWVLPNVIFKQNMLEDSKELTQQLSVLIEYLGIRNREVVIGLPNSLVHSHTIKVSAHLPLQEIEAEILEHLHLKTRMAPDGWIIDFEVLKETLYEKEILFAAARIDYVKHYVSCIEESGLRVAVVEIEKITLARLQAIPDVKPAAEYHLAYGLALREIYSREINLLPRYKERQYSQIKQAHSMVAIAFVAVCLSLWGLQCWLAAHLTEKNKQIDILEEKIFSLEAAKHQRELEKTLQDKSETKLSYYHQYQNATANILLFLAGAPLYATCFKNIAREANVLRVSGYSRSIVDINRFISVLKKSQHFSAISLEQVTHTTNSHFLNFKFQAIEKNVINLDTDTI